MDNRKVYAWEVGTPQRVGAPPQREILDPPLIFAVLELFTCTNHPPLKYCPAIGRHNMARIPDVDTET